MKRKHKLSVARTGFTAVVLIILIALVGMVSISCGRSAEDRPSLLYFNARL